MKYVLTSGCSFTKNKRFIPSQLGENEPIRFSWPESLQKELGDSYKVINLGSATNDNMSIVRILYYWINKLTKSGIKYEDIIVGIQWSDPHRESFYFKKEITNEELKETQHTLSYVKDSDRDGFFFLTGGFAPPEDENIWRHFKGTEFKQFMNMYSLGVLSNNIINSTLHWLESWSHFQLFCEKNNIETFYTSMRNIFSKNVFEHNFDSQFLHKIDSVNWMEKNAILEPYIKELLTNSKFYFYKTFGGLLDWTRDNIDRYSDINPYQELENDKKWKDTLSKDRMMYGHPTPKMMDVFVKEELFPFLIKENIF